MTYKKAANLGKKAVTHAVKEVEKDLKRVVNLVSSKEARQFLSAVISEAKKEQSRVAKFAKKEFKREMKRAKPALKKAVKRLVR